MSSEWPPKYVFSATQVLFLSHFLVPRFSLLPSSSLDEPSFLVFLVPGLLPLFLACSLHPLTVPSSLYLYSDTPPPAPNHPCLFSMGCVNKRFEMNDNKTCISLYLQVQPCLLCHHICLEPDFTVCVWKQTNCKYNIWEGNPSLFSMCVPSTSGRCKWTSIQKSHNYLTRVPMTFSMTTTKFLFQGFNILFLDLANVSRIELVLYVFTEFYSSFVYFLEVVYASVRFTKISN